MRGMPIYEFECEECGTRFEELVAADGSARLPGVRLGDDAAAALDGLAARPPAARRRGPLGRIAAAASAKRRAQDRIAEAQKRRAAGEKP